jgi:hypothetical protein
MFGAPDGLHTLSGPSGFYGASIAVNPATSNNDAAGTMVAQAINITPAYTGLLYCQKN